MGKNNSRDNQFKSHSNLSSGTGTAQPSIGNPPCQEFFGRVFLAVLLAREMPGWLGRRLEPCSVDSGCLLLPVSGRSASLVHTKNSIAASKESSIAPVLPIRQFPYRVFCHRWVSSRPKEETAETGAWFYHPTSTVEGISRRFRVVLGERRFKLLAARTGDGVPPLRGSRSQHRVPAFNGPWFWRVFT